MTVAQPLRLDPLTLPLFGERLIEASAGTGKTYTLAVLYLRLLLGLGQQAAYPRKLSVEEILVVTFTEAATEELRNRIRDNIHRLRIACIRNDSSDPLLLQLLTELADKEEASDLLLAAERQMDEAAIYTIHSFCQRMLSHNAFESGVLFEQSLIEDELPLRRQAVADFWRRHCYPLPLPVAQAISTEWGGPERLLADVMPYLHGEAPQLLQPSSLDDILLRHQQIIERIESLKQQWRASFSGLESLISQSGVDKRSYSTKHLPNWLQKVNMWAEQETQDYTLPKELNNFRQSVLYEKTKKGEAPVDPLFTAVDLIYSEPLTLRDLILSKAISEVRLSVQQEKRRRAEMGFDDLLSRLDSALQRSGAEALAQAIRQRYPVAMIDEFQDTDPQQYRIFHKLYGGREDTGLLLIGDPKQAIYAFRGADIFTYMQARNEVSNHYTMETNWRSSSSMVSSVNQLFQQLPAPFIFQQIPFLPVKAAEKNQYLSFELDGDNQPAVSLWLQPGEGCGLNEYQQFMARCCAVQIREWLTAGQQQRAWLVSGTRRQPVVAADIAILVRTGKEASLVRDALSALGIPSVYLSNRESVFTTPEAKDVLWLLQAVLAPEKERTLRSALASSLLGLDARQIDDINRDEREWDRLVEEFSGYRQLWLKRGVLPMLREVMSRRQLAENLLVTLGGERRLTDIMHIGELLQEASLKLESEHSLVRWLAQQITQPNDRSDSQQLRLESDRNLVRVVTIHKSKGLEYPLVWLPFICGFRQQNQALYHDRETFSAMLDLQQSEDSLTLAEEERLAEDLRLLYVALTRSVYHCSIGVTPLYSGNRRQGNSDIHRSAMGYLLQRGQPGNAAFLADALQELGQHDGIQWYSATEMDAALWQDNQLQPELLTARIFTGQRQNSWRVTSYSGLQQQGASHHYDLLPRFDTDAAGEKGESAQLLLSPHTFPKGAAPGTFLHDLLENVDFTQPINSDELNEKVLLQGLESHWTPVLQQWLETILSSPLDEQGIRLKDISAAERQAELQFYLPIGPLLQAERLDALVKHYDPLSARCPELVFRQVQGMLKGFIDLVFCWQGRYYLLDYKSNWLGESAESYTPQAMADAMCDHRYDLQYQLYSLALHRYLRHRIADYDYQRHFGGVFYLFLRGIEKDRPGQGVFHCRPEWALVDGLDRLFSGQEAIA
ncbi:exodeoxyribonuclease V subunit beta [Limnobaculum zhutongyuii]|uniref:RecBCD enzyme subunit RecB n=1 Tax=Limnobaculum zhutongyuii TaxID=2498113 RepID=A0A411WHB5_9GAMM|nr:exodeoxyribonuclease V subunit beta [Limnobaculum zhutongyuii]QBH95613.1 exodeoxyribonuclease V subunit beta [Limnobaculum zhutongyuii]TQS88695.1 exodeoxyribonuclease V subunit beta [Limnobaculum zhutongyuii]